MTSRPILPQSLAQRTGALQTQTRWINQAARFLSVGMLNTLLDAALYFTLTRWLGFGTRQVLAKSISYGAGILNSYYWNKTWTFKLEGSGNWRVFASFILANLISLAINAVTMVICLEVLALPESLAWLVATGAAFVWNFLVSKFLVFKQ